MAINYELNSNGVYGLRNGVYQDSLVTIVDDHEDSSVSAYGGATSDFADVDEANVTPSAQNGTGLAQLQTSSGAYQGVSSTSGLNAYPSQGDTFRIWVYTGNSKSIRARWATQSEVSAPNMYYVLLNASADSVDLNINNSGHSTLASVSQTLAADTWYELKVDWATDGTMSVTIYDSSGSKLNSLSATDTTFTSGGIGYGINVGSGSATVYADYYRVV